MTARFAGSRSLDERRRRRLAQENEESSSTPSASDSNLESDSVAIAAEVPALSRMPLNKLISPRLWKIGALGFLLLATGGGIVYGGYHIETGARDLGPGFHRLFNLTDQRAIFCYKLTLFAAACQLAMLIGWRRSRSLRDFSGRYRVWPWIAMSGFVIAGCMLTGAHVALSETVFWAWPQLELQNKELLGPLIPLAALSLFAFLFLQRELRNCRWSLSTLVLSIGTWVAVVAFAMGVELPIDALQRRMAHASSEMAGSFLLFMSMLLHARHVLYSTAEAPEIAGDTRQSRLQRWRAARKEKARLKAVAREERLLQKQLEKEEREAAAKAEKAAREAEAEEKRIAAELQREEAAQAKKAAADAARNAKAEKVKSRAAKKRKAVVAEPGTEEEETEETLTQASSRRGSLMAEREMLRVDKGIDNDELKGLSKRERRRRQKQFRENQRAGIDD